MTRRRAPRTTPRQQQAEDRKLRTGGRNCPVCLALLPRLGERAAGSCSACGGHPVQERQCAKCKASSVWEAGANAGCAACGHHGSKVKVLAGQGWLKD